MELDPNEALERWIFQYSLTTAQAALLLGVTRRTVQRWRAERSAPRRLALHIDVWNEGTPLTVSLSRTSLPYACRDNTVRAFLCPEWSSRPATTRAQQLAAQLAKKKREDALWPPYSDGGT